MLHERFVFEFSPHVGSFFSRCIYRTPSRTVTFGVITKLDHKRGHNAMYLGILVAFGRSFFASTQTSKIFTSEGCLVLVEFDYHTSWHCLTINGKFKVTRGTISCWKRILVGRRCGRTTLVLGLQLLKEVFFLPFVLVQGDVDRVQFGWIVFLVEVDQPTLIILVVGGSCRVE